MDNATLNRHRPAPRPLASRPTPSTPPRSPTCCGPTCCRRSTSRRRSAGRGPPANIRADNGPELTAAVLREWCRSGGTGTA
jgi:hypothetical protein